MQLFFKTVLLNCFLCLLKFYILTSKLIFNIILLLMHFCMFLLMTFLLLEVKILQQTNKEPKQIAVWCSLTLVSMCGSLNKSLLWWETSWIIQSWKVRMFHLTQFLDLQGLRLVVQCIQIHFPLGTVWKLLWVFCADNRICPWWWRQFHKNGISAGLWSQRRVGQNGVWISPTPTDGTGDIFLRFQCPRNTWTS